MLKPDKSLIARFYSFQHHFELGPLTIVALRQDLIM